MPGYLAELSKRLKFKLVYISTGVVYVNLLSAMGTTLMFYADYVFDGTSPPYTPSSAPNPLQLYGKSKRDGELAVLGVHDAESIVLRVPVL